MAVHARSLANLGPPFAKGDDPRRANGRSHGASVIEWINRLDRPGMGRQELQRIIDDESELLSKRKAAMSHLRSLSMEHAKNGKPLAYDDLQLQIDHTHGKAVQRVEVTTKEERDPVALTLEYVQLMAEHPELREAMAAEVAAHQVAQLPAADEPESLT